jgi:carbon-monoxide dehydrogenase large subunit
VDANGRILHWQDDFVVDIGAGSLWVGGIISNTAIHLMGPYRVPSAKLTGRAAFTNKCIVAQYRGAGRPEAAFALERSLDAAAAALCISPEEIRRRNLLGADELPYSRPLPYRDGVPISYDGGDFVACLEAAVELLPRSRTSDYAAANPGMEVGYGVSSYIEATGRGPWEAGRVQLDPVSGRFIAATGAASAGMSHETSFAQVVADGLQIPLERVSYKHTDTDRVKNGVGTFASRSAVLAGSALHLAAKELISRAEEFVSQLRNVDRRDVVYREGVFQAPANTMTWQDIAAAISPGGAGEHLSATLDVTHIYRPRTVTWTMGVHAAIVGVERSSGIVRVLDYAVAHEGGAEINPKVVAGQIMGGVAQGIGGALLEEIAYGKNAEPLSTTLFAYHLAGATEVPPVRIKHLAVPSPENPIGVRGAGESGTIAVYATLASAVDDAVGTPFHASSTPISPAVVRRALVNNGVKP